MNDIFKEFDLLFMFRWESVIDKWFCHRSAYSSRKFLWSISVKQEKPFIRNHQLSLLLAVCASWYAKVCGCVNIFFHKLIANIWTAISALLSMDPFGVICNYILYSGWTLQCQLNTLTPNVTASESKISSWHIRWRNSVLN